MHKRSLATAVLCGGLRVAAAHSATNCTAAHSALVAFGEAVMTFKPRPATPVHVALPLAAPAAEVVQAVGGAELNVAVALSLVSAAPIASYVSVLPHGPLGDAVRSAAEASGVATENVVVDGSPHSVLGTLHVVDDGSGPRPHYQRHHSAFATVASGDTFDWPSLLSPAKWLHVTGITPLLGPGPAAAWSTALMLPSRQTLPTSSNTRTSHPTAAAGVGRSKPGDVGSRADLAAKHAIAALRAIPLRLRAHRCRPKTR